MVSLPTPLGGLPKLPPNLPPYPSKANKAIMAAPFPNMGVESVTTPAKRGPEEDVQFVSAHPVKKLRGSGGSPLVQQGQQVAGAGSAPQLPQGPAAETRSSLDHPKGAGPAPGPSEAQPHVVAGRGVSMPGMQHYVFPPPLDSIPSQTSRSSPMVSPKQLPPPMLPSQPHNTPQPTPETLQAPTNYLPLMPQRGLQIPWGMSSLYPQPAPIDPGVNWNSPVPLHPQPQPIEPPVGARNNEQPTIRSPSPQKQAPAPISTSTQRPEPQAQQAQEEQASTAEMPNPRETMETQQTPHDPESEAPSPDRPASPPAPRTETDVQRQSVAPQPPPTPVPTPIPVQPQANSPTNNDNTVVAAQHQVLKPPCLICEQMRQQALFNQANGLPVVQPSHLQHYGWHGLSPYQQQQQVQLGHAPAMSHGLGMQNFGLRLQPYPSGQVPMGYAMPQVPVTFPMSMQRVAPVANTNQAEQVQSGLPQGAQNQQGSLGQPTRVMASMPQFQHPGYIQAQMLPLQQSKVAPGLMTAQASAPAPAPSPPAADQASQAPQNTQQANHPEPRKPSPNLIVDIAETCEDLFPWDEVAKRHNVPRTKVAETFAAVIQLPLLRCTTDKKKHGKLATSRLREYTKAKKDVEAANASSAAKTAPAAAASNTNASQPPQNQAAQPQTGQATTAQNRPLLPGVLEMANTMAPLGLPSTLTNGLTGPWQRQ